VLLTNNYITTAISNITDIRCTIYVLQIQLNVFSAGTDILCNFVT